jgi:GNAT superfamily N-acetyltransferase
MKLDVFLTTDPTLLQAAFALRRQIWAAMPGVDAESALSGGLDDGLDPKGLHWVVTDGDKVVASARLCICESLEELPDANVFQNAGDEVPLPSSAINRLVVHPDYRGQGLASQLDRLRLEEARARGCASITACWSPFSGERRRRAIEALGFVPVQDGKQHPAREPLRWLVGFSYRVR